MHKSESKTALGTVPRDAALPIEPLSNQDYSSTHRKTVILFKRVAVMVRQETIPEEEGGGGGVGVGCSCFGRSSSSRRNTTKSRSLTPAPSSSNGGVGVAGSDPRASLKKTSSRRTSVYFEAQDGIIEENSLEFFDALQELDNDDDDEDNVYPIITRAIAPGKSFRVSFLEPETMLRASSSAAADATAATEKGAQETGGRPAIPTKAKSFARRGSADVGKELREPQVAVQERGYPGLLDEKELAECQKFYREVTSRKGTIRDIVFAYKDIEQEPYTICRFLRPTKFNADAMLTRLEENKGFWEKAAAADFYPDLEAAMGIPPSLFQRFYPFFYQGFAKNGCPVNYFKAGKIHVEGLLSMVTIDQIAYNAWNICKYVFPKMVVKAQERDPNFVRCESVSVIDLEGLTSSQASSETMDIVKQAAKVGDFAPETMHCTLILNAPTWFTMTWKIIRSFIDPRTARKIEVYSSTSRGQFRLQQLVHAAEVPHDFGGMGPPTGETDSPHREALQILHVSKKHRGKQQVPSLAEVGSDEKITALRIFSRSATGLLVDFDQNGASLVKELSIDPPKTPVAGTSLDPYVVDVTKEPIMGPCNISLLARAQANEKKPPSKVSFGYFVVVAFITKK